MSQHENSSLETPDNRIVLHHPLPKSSLESSIDSQTPCTQASGSGDPPEPPRRRPPISGEFWSNNERWLNYQPNEPIPVEFDDLLVVNSRRRNGIILFKRYHAEFAGPGAAVGGEFDQDCQLALPLGNLSLLRPESTEERQRAYALRRQWVRLIIQITNNPVPLQRAQLIINQFEHYFDAKTMAQLPDEALALLVGVLPKTIRMARSLET
jgi:hypothetical protein